MAPQWGMVPQWGMIPCWGMEVISLPCEQHLRFLSVDEDIEEISALLSKQVPTELIIRSRDGGSVP